jgi:hypothetical protein
MASLDKQIAAAMRKRIEIEEQQQLHGQKDVYTRSKMHVFQDARTRVEFWRQVGPRLERQLMGGSGGAGGGPPSSLKFRSDPSLLILHIDDSSALQVPMVPMQTGTNLVLLGRWW